MRAELGALSSKSALSAAARGRELPSWDTTWEFVRCLLPADTELEPLRHEWRRRWETARDEADAALPAPLAPPARPPRRRRRSALLAAVACVLAGVLAWVVLRVTSSGGSDRAQRPIPGDDSQLVADVTVPDGTVLHPGQPFLKVWELRNDGTVAWHNRYLQRMPGLSFGACSAPGRTPVPSTPPGHTVLVSVVARASNQPDHCKVYWKMVDKQGREYFPGLRPAYFEVIVRH
jgi:hypothetical protein